MKTISVTLDQAVNATITEPVFLIKITGADQTLYLSSNGDIVFDGQLYSGYSRVLIQGLGNSGALNNNGSITIIDPTLTAVQLFLNTSLRAAQVEVYQTDQKVFGDPEYTPVSSDAINIFDGIIGDISINESTASVTLSLTTAGSRILFMPRRTIGPEIGVTRLIAPGTQIKVGSNTYTLERR